jgi:biopolymer transport protein ExbB
MFTTPPATQVEAKLSSLFDMVVSGGPVMVPIGLASVVALAYTIERLIRLRPSQLGTARLGREIVAAADQGGPAAALSLCRERPRPLARILAAGLARFGSPRLEMEKAVEDAGQRELRRLSANLRPLVVVASIAPLLGLFGTVWGIIQAFRAIGEGGMGRPEVLSYGIGQALVTTAAGLAIAIPTQAAYYYFRGRIDAFVRGVEDVYQELEEKLASHRLPQLERGGAA